MEKVNKINSRKKYERMNRKGGLSDISSEKLVSYFDYLATRGNNLGYQTKILPSVARFSELIQSEPVLRLNWEHGISRC
jgi:hypothetical protein